jgi:hypothetical protein
MLRSSSIISAKKNFFYRARMLRTRHAYRYIYKLCIFLCISTSSYVLFCRFQPVPIRKKPNRFGISMVWFLGKRFGLGWNQNPEPIRTVRFGTEPFRDVSTNDFSLWQFRHVWHFCSNWIESQRIWWFWLKHTKINHFFFDDWFRQF